MVTSLTFSQIPHFSRLFVEFIKDNPLIAKRFPIKDADCFKKRALHFSGRVNLLQSITATMSGLALTDAQRQALSDLSKNNSLTVVTGQQVGFLGGAEYTALKLHSAVHKAKTLAAKHPELLFAPVFWVEDDDHDYLEAAETTLITSSGEPKRVSCATSNEILGLPACLRTFDSNILNVVQDIKNALSNTPNYNDFSELLSDIYAPGNGWSKAFIQLLQLLFGETGILFISASEIRKHGLSSDIITREFESYGRISRCIEDASRQLTDYGFHNQISGSSVNVFYMESNGKRIKIQKDASIYSAGAKKWQIKDLLAEAKSNPERFSPNVALRPIVQDTVLPTAYYIAGPGETSYYAQLKEAYEVFDVEMPIIAQRHSATILLPSVVRFLDKSGLSPKYFMQSWNIIDREFSVNMQTDEFSALMGQAVNEINNTFNRIVKFAASTDQTLEGSVNAALHQTLKSVDNIQKKIISAVKRKNEVNYSKYRLASNVIYPNGALQERTLSFASWMPFTNNEIVQKAFHSIVALPANTHYFIPLFQ